METLEILLHHKHKLNKVKKKKKVIFQDFQIVTRILQMRTNLTKNQFNASYIC